MTMLGKIGGTWYEHGIKEPLMLVIDKNDNTNHSIYFRDLNKLWPKDDIEEWRYISKPKLKELCLKYIYENEELYESLSPIKIRFNGIVYEDSNILY